VIPIKSKKDPSKSTLKIQGSSLDEVAILEALRERKESTFIDRYIDSIEVKIGETTYKYTLLATNEFSSERKLMSVLVKEQASGDLLLLVKGADTMMAPLRSAADQQDSVSTKVFEKCDNYAELGLRTLVFGYRTLTEADISSIDLKDMEATKALEKDLTMLGCTGVQDELQDEVNSCITDFRDANIKVWMLTGDKDKTALEIGI
jgi:magnesium-transporting ATPase (P-type)